MPEREHLGFNIGPHGQQWPHHSRKRTLITTDTDETKFWQLLRQSTDAQSADIDEACEQAGRERSEYDTYRDAITEYIDASAAMMQADQAAQRLPKIEKLIQNEMDKLEAYTCKREQAIDDLRAEESHLESEASAARCRWQDARFSLPIPTDEQAEATSRLNALRDARLAHKLAHEAARVADASYRQTMAAIAERGRPARPEDDAAIAAARGAADEANANRIESLDRVRELERQLHDAAAKIEKMYLEVHDNG